MRILLWLLKKLSGSVLIVVLGLGLCASLFYFADAFSFEDRKNELMQAFRGERTKLLQARDSVERRRQDLLLQKSEQQLRQQSAKRALIALGELQSPWAWPLGDRTAQLQYSSRKEKLLALKRQTELRLLEIDQLLTLEDYTKEGLDIALGRLEKRLEQMHQAESIIMRYLRKAWDYSKGYLLVALATWFLGPLLGKSLFYFGLAPFLGKASPIRISTELGPLPQLGESRSALELEIPAGHSLCAKECFLQASDENLRKTNRFLFDWSLPFTSLACRLTEMIELGNSSDKGVAFRVTLSSSDDAMLELCSVRMEEGSALVLRPRHIAAILSATGKAPEIRRHWVFFRWHAWLTLQFRYFEFRGPMTLILAGARGLRVENLSGRGEVVARRVNSNAIVGFSSDLVYRPVRAETFWAYYRGQNPLFDDLFEGEGLFLCQANSREDKGKGEGFWSGIGNTVLRLLGI
jgi:hypothetical protein